MNIFLRKFHGAIRRYRVARVRLGVKFLDVGKEEQIKSPIFLIGLTGGGLTLLSFILHHHPQVVYLTGNYRYWAGEDEMYNLLSDLLPKSLTWHTLENLPFRHRIYGAKKHGEIYASGEVLPFYRSTAESFSLKDKRKLETIIRKIIAINKPKGVEPPFRFVDKSQLYALKVGLLQELLKEYNPKFVLLVRNPFAWCWRRMLIPYSLVYSKPKLSDKQWLKVAVEHWTNTYKAALEDKKEADLAVWRFEDLLMNPQRIVSEIFKFVNLEFNLEFLPKKEDKIPWGSLYGVFTYKWYPIRPDVNRKYLANIPNWAIEIIEKEAGELIEKFGYSKEGP